MSRRIAASQPESEAGKRRKDREIYLEMPKYALNSIVKDINLLIRLMAYKEHNLLFLEDYSIPPHNNDAEKCAHTVKIHNKPNGGMMSEEYTGYYADTASVLETERRKMKSLRDSCPECGIYFRPQYGHGGKEEEAVA